MAYLEIDTTKRAGIIDLGVQGENDAEGAKFDITTWYDDYGSGTAYLYNQRRTDTAPYFKELPVNEEDGAKKALWLFDDADTAVEGDGVCQLLYVVGDVIKKTSTYITTTGKSLGEASGDVPDPYEDLLERVREIYQSIVTERDAAEQACSNAAEYADDASGSAAEAAASATLASNVFRVAGNVSFPVDPNTGAVSAVFTEEE